MPRESLDAPENLPKERRCQAALGQLQDEVSGVPRGARAPSAPPRYTYAVDQHTVTRSYLEALCDPVTPELHDPSIWVVRLREGSIKRRAPHNVAVEVDYYSRRLPSGEVDDGFEQMLSGVESDAAPVLRRIRDGHFSLTDDERERLAIFVSFMMVRVPSFRKYVDRALNRTGEALMRATAQRPDYFARRLARHSLSAEQVAEMRHLWLNDGDPKQGIILQASPDLSLGHALLAALAPVPYLLGMRWQFLVSKGDPFITGDTPVTKRNDRIRPPLAAGVGLPDTEVTFPISPSVCFRAWWKDGQDVVEIGDSEVARVNRERVRFAEREVFAPGEGAAQTALEVYAELLERGEAHANSISLMLIEGDAPPKPI